MTTLNKHKKYKKIWSKISLLEWLVEETFKNEKVEVVVNVLCCCGGCFDVVNILVKFVGGVVSFIVVEIAAIVEEEMKIILGYEDKYVKEVELEDRAFKIENLVR